MNEYTKRDTEKAVKDLVSELNINNGNIFIIDVLIFFIFGLKLDFENFHLTSPC